MITVNPNCSVDVKSFGQEGNLVVIVDDFLNDLSALSEAASRLDNYQYSAKNHYPGIRKETPTLYHDILAEFIRDKILEYFQFAPTSSVQVLQSLFSLVTQSEASLSPIQSIPHFDTPLDDQLASVHYLCGPGHGGTSFYGHKQSGYEAILPERLPDYRKWLSREMTTHGLPEARYLSGDTSTYSRLLTVSCQFNRIIFYKSNVLHSGNIKTDTDISSDPASGRLTAASFIKINP